MKKKDIGRTLFPNQSPPKIGPLEVKIRGSFEEAVKIFKLSFQKEKIIKQLKERQAFEKPSAKQRRRRREAVERRLLAESRDRLMRTGEWEQRLRQKEAKKRRKLEDRLRHQDSLEDYSNE